MNLCNGNFHISNDRLLHRHTDGFPISEKFNQRHAPHLGISKAHSNIKLCIYMHVLSEELNLCTYRLVRRRN